MHKGHTLQRLLVTILTISLLSSGFSQAQVSSPSGLDQDRANLGFGTAVRDAEVLNLLQRHRVAPQAAFMWVAGLTGTYRNYNGKNAQTFLQEARAQTIEGFEKSLQSNTMRLRSFVAKITEAEVVANTDLQQQVRSLLNLRASLETALATAKRGDPLILALEVSGDTASIQPLGKETMVKTFRPAVIMSGRVVAPSAPIPEAYQGEYLNPTIQALNAQELYQQLHALANMDAKEGK